MRIDIFLNAKIEQLDNIERKVTKIMANLQELEAKIAELSLKVDEDIAQGAAIITAVNDLLARIPPSADYQPQIDALNAIIAKVTSDNPAIQTAIDAANAHP